MRSDEFDEGTAADGFMSALRSEPRAEFETALRRRLHDEAVTGARHPAWAASRVAAVAAAMLSAAGLLALPAVRASAQAFLDLFRVVNFTAVPVDISRVNELGKKGLDIPTLVGEQLEVLEDPGPPRIVGSPAEASAALHLRLKLPSAVPPWMPAVRTEIEGERVVRVTADTRKLTNVLDALGLSDVRPPPGLDGQVVVARVPPVVRVTYAQGQEQMVFLQGKSPEVTLPAALDLATLGEIGLRILGLGKAEAHTLAQAVDWRSTMIMPVPAGVSSFRQVDVHGHRGLLVESATAHPGKELMWSDGGSIYVFTGSNREMMAQAAESVR
jgi:hypothetical protein